MGGDTNHKSPGMLLSSLVSWPIGMVTTQMKGDLSHTSILYYCNMRDQKLKTFPYVSYMKWL